MVSKITFFIHNSTPPSSSLPDSLQIFCQWEEPQHQIINSKTSWRTKVFQSPFFPYCIKIWNGLDPELENIDSYKEFKSKISSFIKMKSNSIFSVHDVYGVELLSWLRLNFIYLNEHKARHGFKNWTNSLYDCCSATETTSHFLLQCQQYQTIWLELFNSIYNLDPNIRKLFNDKYLHLFLYGSSFYSLETNREIIKPTIKFLKLFKRFKRPLLWPVFPLPPLHLRKNLTTVFWNFW